MPKVVIAAIAGLAVGIALAAWYRSPAPAEAAGGEIDAGADFEDRLLALEAAVGAERDARQLLEDELLVLYEALDGLEGGASGAAVGRPSATANSVRQRADPLQVPPVARPRRADDELRLQQMTAAGFSEVRAERILQRESELRMQAMQARYDAMRSDTPLNPLDRALNPGRLLREEIGDAEYERYLEAQGRPTAVDVRRIMEASPAMNAGLQSGDRITHYDGRRVFNTAELTRQTMQGVSGENVVVDIVRDGVPMQVLMPRGPLGIMAGRGR